jgi:hypothetical protein
MEKPGTRAFSRLLGAALLTLPLSAAHAIVFNMDYGDGVEGTLNTSITAGAAMRMQGRAVDLVSKSNNNPGVCGGVNQSCQAVYRDQTHPARALAAAPGQATNNADDGNWNYDKHDLTQGVVKLTQDLKLTYGDFGFFGRWLYFYDFVNNDFEEYHPNRITPENANAVRNQNSGCGEPGSDPFSCNPNPLFFEGTYGAGGVVRNRRTDGEVLRQIGTDFQLLDAYLYGQVPLFGDHRLTFKIGRLSVNWGQSTVLVFSSINSANPLHLNNFLRVGNVLSSAEEVFVPTGMVFLSTEPFSNATLEGFYGWEWQPVEIPAPGTFMSFLDIGTNNAVMNAGINFGGGAEDPFRIARPQANPLSGLTNTTITLERLEDNEPAGTNQYGVSFRYYADTLNNGTELGLFFMNYHSKLPYASFYASNGSCARQGGVHGSGPLGEGQDINAYDGPSLILACPDLPVLHPTDPENATSNAVPIDTVKLRLEYPENIKMFGASFATTLGDYSVQGEVAYRPSMPLQVDPEDLVFAALQPMLAKCHDPNFDRAIPSEDQLAGVNALLGNLFEQLGLPIGVPNISPAGQGCAGSTTGIGYSADGRQVPYAPSDFIAPPGVAPYKDTFDLIIGHAVGSARSFPSFVGAYRGYAAGEVPANEYLRGWETFKSFQFNLGLTKVIGATDNWIGADQIIMLYEFGANWTPDLPSMDVLQIEGPGTFYHASAGADGSGADGGRQACAATVDCSLGGDGLRFNPHQQDTDGYADRFSWGYRVVSIVRYESVLPAISLAPFFLWWHDVNGTQPDPSNQFLDGRRIIQSNLEVRYKEALSFTAGYTWFMGGGQYNLWRDRDNATFFVKYQF